MQRSPSAISGSSVISARLREIAEITGREQPTRYLQSRRSLGSFQRSQKSQEGAFAAISAISWRPPTIAEGYPWPVCKLCDLWAASRNRRPAMAPPAISISGLRETAEMQGSPFCDICELGDFWAASRNRRKERVLLCDICNPGDPWVASLCSVGIRFHTKVSLLLPED